MRWISEESIKLYIPNIRKPLNMFIVIGPEDLITYIFYALHEQQILFLMREILGLSELGQPISYSINYHIYNANERLLNVLLNHAIYKFSLISSYKGFYD